MPGKERRMNLIDRDALIAKLEITERCIECKWVNGAYCNRWNTFADACEAILKAPVIEQPEIIRCKDCKHNMKSSKAGNACCDIFYGMTNQYGFCHMGERRTDG